MIRIKHALRVMLGLMGVLAFAGCASHEEVQRENDSFMASQVSGLDAKVKVATQGDLLVACVSELDGKKGAVYVYRKAQNNFTNIGSFFGQHSDDKLGSACAVDGGIVVASSAREVFRYDCTQSSCASNYISFTFGNVAAIAMEASSNLLVLGTPDRESAHVFRLSDILSIREGIMQLNGTPLHGRQTPRKGTQIHAFGQSLAVKNGKIAVGASGSVLPSASSPQGEALAGLAFVYDATSCAQQGQACQVHHEVTIDPGIMVEQEVNSFQGAAFGYSVDLDDANGLLTSAPGRKTAYFLEGSEQARGLRASTVDEFNIDKGTLAPVAIDDFNHSLYLGVSSLKTVSGAASGAIIEIYRTGSGVGGRQIAFPQEKNLLLDDAAKSIASDAIGVVSSYSSNPPTLIVFPRIRAGVDFKQPSMLRLGATKPMPLADSLEVSDIVL